jgi:hypothetical protein
MYANETNLQVLAVIASQLANHVPSLEHSFSKVHLTGGGWLQEF